MQIRFMHIICVKNANVTWTWKDFFLIVHNYKSRLEFILRKNIYDLL